MKRLPRHPLIRLIDEVIRLRGRLQSVFAGVGEATGLAPMESTVLTAVVESHATPTVSQIGRSLGHPRQVIQRAANDLIAAGLLVTAVNPDHKRAALLRPTAAGRKAYHDAEVLGRKTANALMRSLDLKECERLAGELHLLRGKIESHLRRRDPARLRAVPMTAQASAPTPARKRR